MFNSAENDIKIAELIARKAAAAGGCAYYVGGCVRDELMGKSLKDIDIEVHGITPKALSDILDEIGEKLVIGSSFGIFGLRGYDLDIAMPRTEKNTGRGHRDFEVFVDPFLGVKKAAERRDFTINAMMKNVLTGELIDCFSGQEDLKNGVIRHVNDASFVEDPLRVFRAAQFAARFGFTVAESTVELCGTVDLDALPPERVYAELEKALTLAGRPSLFFSVLDGMGQLGGWFKELKTVFGTDEKSGAAATLDRAAGYRAEAEYPEGFMTAAVCAGLTEDEADGTEKIKTLLSRLTSERRLIRYVLDTAKKTGIPEELYQRNAVKEEFFALFDGSVCPNDLALLSLCGLPDERTAKKRKEFYSRLLDEFKELMSRPFVAGRDLIEAGIEPGESYSDILGFAHSLRLRGVERSKALEETLAYAERIKNK